MSNKMERRYLAHEFRVSDDATPTIYGYAAKFGVRSEDLGGWVEVLSPTCFDACLATNPDVRALFNHDPNLILGRTSAGTAKLTKDATGLAFEVIPPDTQAARDLIVSMRRKDINQSSFAFTCDNAVWSYDEVSGLEIRTVLAATLYDVSPVTYPAYAQATSGVRCLPADVPVEVRSRLESRAIPKDPAAAPTHRWSDRAAMRLALAERRK